MQVLHALGGSAPALIVRRFASHLEALLPRLELLRFGISAIGIWNLVGICAVQLRHLACYLANFSAADERLMHAEAVCKQQAEAIQQLEVRACGPCNVWCTEHCVLRVAHRGCRDGGAAPLCLRNAGAGGCVCSSLAVSVLQAAAKCGAGCGVALIPRSLSG